MASDDDLAMELEALRYTYPEIQIEEGPALAAADDGAADAGAAGAAPSPAASASIALRPRGARQAFVSATLHLAAPAGYPATSPSIQLLDPRGLGDARAAALLARLNAEAADLAGGPCLGALVEACQDGLTEANAPEGAAAAQSGGAPPARSSVCRRAEPWPRRTQSAPALSLGAARAAARARRRAQEAF